MNIFRLKEFTGGWFIGDFEPSLIRSPEFELGLKEMRAGSSESFHFQKTATEITLVVSGKCRLGENVLTAGDIAVIPPLESADFEALQDTVLVVLKSPSIPSDKVDGHP